LSADPDVNHVVDRVLERIKENMRTDDHLGSFQNVSVKKLKNGEILEEETKTYRTIWIQGKSYNELIQVNSKDLDEKQKREEFKRKAEFIKSLQNPSKSKSKGMQQELQNVEWWALQDKYDFTLLDHNEYSGYIVGFCPKKTRLSEDNRVERILNHVAGKVWIDPDYNVVQAETYLQSPVKFAWGIVKLDQMNAEYQQQKYGDSQIPSLLHIRFKAHAGIFKTEHQEITATWFNVFTKPGSNNSQTAELDARK
jgi:hypothetical protein